MADRFGLATDAMLGHYLFEVMATAPRTKLTGSGMNLRLRDVGLILSAYQEGMQTDDKVNLNRPLP